MTTADLHAARGAIKRSAATRTTLRGQFPADRDERLRATLATLSEAMAPINAQLRSGPLTGRSLRNRNAREMSEALQAERSKVRAMLRRASGGNRRPSSVPYQRGQFRSSLGDIVRRTNAAESALDHVLPQMRKGTPEYREQAQALLDDVDRIQRRLTTRRAQVRYWAKAGAWGRLTKRDHALAETATATARRLSRLRKRAKAAVAVPIRFGFTASPKAGSTAKRRRWTEEDAYAALLAFTREHGRPPKATDFPNDPALPSYAKVHQLFGGLRELSHDLTLDTR